jgi:hypothetical protein
VHKRTAWDSVEWSVATRCRRGEAMSGDLAVVNLLPEGALVGAIDGLGHGREAARAAGLAGEVIRERPSAAPAAQRSAWRSSRRRRAR